MARVRFFNNTHNVVSEGTLVKLCKLTKGTSKLCLHKNSDTLAMIENDIDAHSWGYANTIPDFAVHGALLGLDEDDHPAYWIEGEERTGEFSTTGYVQGRKCGVFAYLATPSSTTIVNGGDYYPISGTFINAPVDEFTLIPLPGIQYDGTKSQYFLILWHAAVRSSANGRTIHCGVNKNDQLLEGSIMCTYCKTSGETYNLSGNIVVELSQNDTIQLVVSSDNDGDIITFQHYTTSINEFFD